MNKLRGLIAIGLYDTGVTHNHKLEDLTRKELTSLLGELEWAKQRIITALNKQPPMVSGKGGP